MKSELEYLHPKYKTHSSKFFFEFFKYSSFSYKKALKGANPVPAPIIIIDYE